MKSLPIYVKGKNFLDPCIMFVFFRFDFKTTFHGSNFWYNECYFLLETKVGTGILELNHQP